MRYALLCKSTWYALFFAAQFNVLYVWIQCWIYPGALPKKHEHGEYVVSYAFQSFLHFVVLSICLTTCNFFQAEMPISTGQPSNRLLWRKLSRYLYDKWLTIIYKYPVKANWACMSMRKSAATLQLIPSSLHFVSFSRSCQTVYVIHYLKCLQTAINSLLVKQLIHL